MNRSFEIAVLSGLMLCLAGCTSSGKERVWEQVKIGDLALVHSGGQPGVQPLRTMNFNLHIFEIPAENIGKLEDVWQSLYTQPLRFYNYPAFNANLFKVRFGKRYTWSGIRDTLAGAGGKRMGRFSLLLADGKPQDITITGLGNEQEVCYISSDGSREEPTVGPGILGLRIAAQKIASERGVCNVVACPVFSPPMPSAGLLAEQAKSHELKFTGAGFGLKMGLDDYVVLGPRKYISEQTMLPGLFFSNPAGTFFLDESKRKGPERKSSVRVFVLVCTSINI